MRRVRIQLLALAAEALAFAVAGTLTGCHAGPTSGVSTFTGSAFLAPLPADEAAHDELLQADLGRADSVAVQGFSAGLVANVASDAVFLRGGLPIVRGRRAIRALADTGAVDAGTAVRWQPVRAEVSRDRATGYTYGYSIQAVPAASAPRLRVDRYIAFWRRDAEGWRIVAYAETYGSVPFDPVPSALVTQSAIPDVPMSPAQGALEEIRQADVAFSVDASRSGTGKAFGNFAAPDAQIFSGPGEFVTGPAAIAGSFGPPTANGVLVWHPVLGAVSLSGDLGYTVGTAIYTGRREDGGQVVRYSNYLTVWRRQRDGSWRFVVDGGSTRPAP